MLSVGARTQAGDALVGWMDLNSSRLFLSVISIAEIEEGIAKVRLAHAVGKAGRLAAWLEAVLHLYSNRIFAFDLATARISGKLSDHARSRGHSPGFPDLAIAATAVAHGLTVLTRNARHFPPLGVPVHDPFASLPVD